MITFSHQDFFKIERIEGIEGIIHYSRYGPKEIAIGNTIFDVAVRGYEPKKAIPRYDIYGHEGGASNYFVDQGFPSWSHSGKKLAFTRNGDIWVATVIEKEDENDKESYDITRVAAVAVYDEPTLRASRDNIVATNISWTPDENQIIYSYHRYTGSGITEVHLLDLESGKEVNLLGSRAVISPNLSPDGQFVAYQSYECGKNNDEKVILQCVWVASLDEKVIQKIVDNAWSPEW